MTSIVTEVTDFCSSQFFWALRSSRKSPKDYQGSRIFLGDCFGSRDFLGDCSVGLCRGVRTSYTFSPVPIPNAESTIRFTPGSKELAARSRQALPFLLLPLHLPFGCMCWLFGFPSRRWFTSIEVRWLLILVLARWTHFRCKVSYRYVGLKGHALVSSMAFRRLKKSSFFLSTSYYKNEYFFPKTLQTLPRNTYKAP